MNKILESVTGMNAMTDQVIASGFLMDAKAGVKMYASALTEAATPGVRQMLKTQLDDSINTHEKIFNYMQSRNWYQAYDMNAQIQMDLQNSQKAMGLPASM